MIQNKKKACHTRLMGENDEDRNLYRRLNKNVKKEYQKGKTKCGR